MVNIVEESKEVYQRKRACDSKLMSKLAYPLYIYKMSPSVRAVENMYFKNWGTWIPYEDFGFPNLISYLHSVPGLVLVRNPINNQYHVSEDQDDASNSILKVLVRVHNQYTH